MENKQRVGYGHILKYTSVFGGVQGIVILISLVRNKAMAILLGAGGMGFNALLMAMQNFASQCTNLGISFGAVPRLSSLYDQQHERQLLYNIQVIRLWSLIAAALGIVFCVVVSPLMNHFTFTWGDHTLHYALLSLAVAMSAITSGEFAILKATRKLSKLVKTQIYTVLLTLVSSVPLYYFYGQSGILPAIVLIAFLTMLVYISYSYRCYPFSFVFRRSMLREGREMIRLGVAFVFAAAIGSATEVTIRAYLNVEGNLDDVGLYNAAYMIVITYGGMVFSSLEVDYFPRLSAVIKDIANANEMVNKQIEVSVLLLSPMLVALLMFLPVLVPLLFSSQFIPVVTMAQVAVLAMYFKVLTMPVSYITLARSRSLAFLLLETTYFLALVIGIVLGYTYWGIFGTGIAIVAAHAVEFLTTWSYAYWKYEYRCTQAIGRYALIQLLIGCMAYAVSVGCEGMAYWIAEAALAIASTAYSLRVLRQKTHLWQSLVRRFRRNH